MTEARELPRRDYDRLLIATTDLVESDCGGNRRAEQHTRVSHQQLGHYRNGEDAQGRICFMPIDIVADLETEAASRGRPPAVTTALAELLGFRLVRMREVLAAESDEQGLLTSAKESTEAIATAWAAKADGRITPDERAEVLKQFDEALVALEELRARWAMGD